MKELFSLDGSNEFDEYMTNLSVTTNRRNRYNIFFKINSFVSCDKQAQQEKPTLNTTMKKYKSFTTF